MAEARPILPYQVAPAAFRAWDPRVVQVAARVAALVRQAAPWTRPEHVGSTAVSGLAGKGVVDLLVENPPARLEALRAALRELGFRRQRSGHRFPDSRPMLVGSVEEQGERFALHLHVVPEGSAEAAALRHFRDRLRADPALRAAYEGEKRRLLEAGVHQPARYSRSKGGFVRRALGKAGD